MKKDNKGLYTLFIFISLAVIICIIAILVITLSNTPKTPPIHDEPGEHQGVIEYNPDTKPIEVKVKDAYPIETGIIVQSEDEMLIELSYEVNDLSPEDAPEPGSTISILPTEDEKYYRLVE